MTNKEAINLLLFMKRNVLPDTDDDKALDLAIEALKDKVKEGRL